jgi:hypothetical protein
MLEENTICLKCKSDTTCNLRKCCKNCYEEDCQERHCLLIDQDYENIL